MNDEMRQRSSTTDGQPARPGFENAPAPAPVDPATGMHEAYWVLSPEELAKGFVRPVRTSYRHVGIPGPKYPLRDLTDAERERYAECGYVKFEAYAEDEAPLAGRFWTQAQLDSVGKGCRGITIMGKSIAETYAREPHYYGSTFCATCQRHFPVGVHGEFVWDHMGTRVGT